MKDNLILEIEKVLKFMPCTNKDFVKLSNLIKEKTNQYVSSTTLKRVWGHKHDYNSPSPFTLNVLARYLDYPDYDHFCRQEKSVYSSFFVDTYCTCHLTKGDKLQLTWSPDRRLVLLYLDNDQFEVTASENGKLVIGDTVSTKCFIEGEPITFSNVMHAGKGPFIYVAGKASGIHVTPLDDDSELPPPGKATETWLIISLSILTPNSIIPKFESQKFKFGDI